MITQYAFKPVQSSCSFVISAVIPTIPTSTTVQQTAGWKARKAWQGREGSMMDDHLCGGGRKEESYDWLTDTFLSVLSVISWVRAQSESQRVESSEWWLLVSSVQSRPSCREHRSHDPQVQTDRQTGPAHQPFIRGKLAWKQNNLTLLMTTYWTSQAFWINTRLWGIMIFSRNIRGIHNLQFYLSLSHLEQKIW